MELVFFSYFVWLWCYLLVWHGLRDLVKLTPDAKLSMDRLPQVTISATSLANRLVITHVLGVSFGRIRQTSLQIDAEFDRSLRLRESRLCRISQCPRVPHSVQGRVFHDLHLSLNVGAVEHSKHALGAVGSHQVVTLVPQSTVSVLALQPFAFLRPERLSPID